MVSSIEQQLLQSIAPELDVHLVSLIQETSPSAVPGFDERRGAFFVGGFEHPPNVDAVVWFVGEVMPLIRRRISGLRNLDHRKQGRLPRCRSWRHPTSTFSATFRIWTRFSPAVDSRLRPCASVPVSREKVLQSLSAGLPCVMTTIAAEGIGLENEVDALIADEPEAFADHVVRVYRDAELWCALSTRGRQTLQERFSAATAERALEKMLVSLGLPWP